MAIDAPISIRKVKFVLVYLMTTGRNFDEVLRVIDQII
jgi:alkyl hydroperoxide reductase subunit AhpC